MFTPIKLLARKTKQMKMDAKMECIAEMNKIENLVTFFEHPKKP